MGHWHRTFFFPPFFLSSIQHTLRHFKSWRAKNLFGVTLVSGCAHIVLCSVCLLVFFFLSLKYLTFLFQTDKESRTIKRLMACGCIRGLYNMKDASTIVKIPNCAKFSLAVCSLTAECDPGIAKKKKKSHLTTFAESTPLSFINCVLKQAV